MIKRIYSGKCSDIWRASNVVKFIRTDRTLGLDLILEKRLNTGLHYVVAHFDEPGPVTFYYQTDHYEFNNGTMAVLMGGHPAIDLVQEQILAALQRCTVHSI